MGAEAPSWLSAMPERLRSYLVTTARRALSNIRLAVDDAEASQRLIKQT